MRFPVTDGSYLLLRFCKIIDELRRLRAQTPDGDDDSGSERDLRWELGRLYRLLGFDEGKAEIYEVN